MFLFYIKRSIYLKQKYIETTCGKADKEWLQLKIFKCSPSYCPLFQIKKRLGFHNSRITLPKADTRRSWPADQRELHLWKVPQKERGKEFGDWEVNWQKCTDKAWRSWMTIGDTRTFFQWNEWREAWVSECQTFRMRRARSLRVLPSTCKLELSSAHDDTRPQSLNWIESARRRSWK